VQEIQKCGNKGIDLPHNVFFREIRNELSESNVTVCPSFRLRAGGKNRYRHRASTYNKCTEFSLFHRVTIGCTGFSICQLSLGLNEVTGGEEIFLGLRFKGGKVRQNSLADVQLQSIIPLSKSSA